MNNKLYVGNLSFRLEESQLESEFAQFGTVKSVKIITDFETGRSRGFGFVEMETEEEAQASIEKLDGAEFEGRTLRVNIAKEKEKRNNRSQRW